MMGYQMYLIKKYKNLNKDEMSYVATLTHDLKSPATAQINMLNLLLNGHFGALNPKQYEMLKMTCSSAKYMSNLVGSVLTFYKYSSNSIVLSKSNFDLVSLINSVIKQNELLISDKNMKVRFNCINPICMVNGDKLQIERVLINLFTNAVTYGFENTDIIINLKYIDGIVNFSISNKSHFIPQKELKNVFKMFSKTVNSRRNSASIGLGLYASKQIIAKHGWEIYANSTPDGTCTFGFRLSEENKDAKLLNK
jgi:two-component system sensor histidine kinase VanS